MLAPHYTFPAGSVLTDAAIEGYRRERHVRALPSSTSFAAQRDAVLDWAVQRRSGLRIIAADGSDAGPVRQGLEVDLRVPIALGLRLTAPVHVLQVIDGPSTAGFVYATRPGHPERGEEAFLLHRTLNGPLELEIRVLSRPSMPFALVAPLARVVQRRYTRRYLHALT
jgi:uncharacterized protein (UPF0548 family)